MSLLAPVKWAQRKESLYLTINLPDVQGEEIQLTPTTLTFHGTSQGNEYHLDFEFFDEVDSEGSKWTVLDRSIQMNIMKKDQDRDEHWPRLLKDKALEKTNVTIDWDKFVDEDEDDEENKFDMSAFGNGGMDFGGGMGGMPGMGGMGGMPGMGGMGGMPGMGGMGGMPGMGGMGGMGGLGGMPGMEGMEGMDMNALLSSMGGMGGLGGMGGMGGMPGMDGEDSDDEEGSEGEDEADGEAADEEST
jgi:hypothetical protein